jgi:membrane protein YqaA with SNARE-associated domain
VTEVPPRLDHGQRAAKAGAAAWGFAEATVFFIVPDVLLTRLALRDLRLALLAAAYAVGGALAGGALLWWAAGHGYAPQLLTAFAYLPGISPRLVHETGAAIGADGLKALFVGGFVGEPYKLLATHAGAQRIALAPFLAVSLAARLSRFVVTILVAWAAGRALTALSLRAKQWLHAMAWLAFYAWYFTIMR